MIDAIITPAEQGIDWKLGACADHPDHDLWFPHAGQARKIEQAQAECARCPLRQQCLDTALGRDETFGVWGGVFFG